MMSTPAPATSACNVRPTRCSAIRCRSPTGSRTWPTATPFGLTLTQEQTEGILGVVAVVTPLVVSVVRKYVTPIEPNGSDTE